MVSLKARQGGVSPRTIRKRILKVTILARNPQATRSDIAFIYNGFLPRS